MGGNIKFQYQDSFFGIFFGGRLGDLKNKSHFLKKATFKSLLSCYIFCANSVSPPHGDLHLIFIDDQIGSGENVWDDTCLPPEFSLA